MAEAYADSDDEGKQDALIQGSAFLLLLLDASFSLLLSLLHLLMTIISILWDQQSYSKHKHTMSFHLEGCVYMSVCMH